MWIDLETTGLDTNDRILEVALIVTDDSLEEKERFEVVLTLGYGNVSDWCQREYDRNGLMNECLVMGVPPHIAEARLVGVLSKYGPGPLVAAGSSVHTDLGFLARWMPGVSSLFSHQTVDVTTLMLMDRRLKKQWDEDKPKPARRHRAMSDVEDSLALMRWYVSHWLR